MLYNSPSLSSLSALSALSALSQRRTLASVLGVGKISVRFIVAEEQQHKKDGFLRDFEEPVPS
jgi:hypothetical protein